LHGSEVTLTHSHSSPCWRHEAYPLIVFLVLPGKFHVREGCVHAISWTEDCMTKEHCDSSSLTTTIVHHHVYNNVSQL